MAHKDSKYSVNSRLAAAEAELLHLRQDLHAIEKIPGPQGAQGQTGASGVCRCQNGKDGAPGKNAVGIQGATGRAGTPGCKGDRGAPGATPRFKIGEVQTIDSDQPARVWLSGSEGLIVLNFEIPRGAAIKGDTGSTGETGARGEVYIIGDSEAASELLKLRKRHAEVLAKLKYDLELDGGHHRGLDQVLRRVRQAIVRDLESGVK